MARGQKEKAWAEAVDHKARLAAINGDVINAASLWQQTLEIYQRLNIVGRQGNALSNLGELARQQMQNETAHSYFELAIPKLRSARKWDWLANALEGLANLACSRKAYSEALSHHKEGLRLRRKVGDMQYVAHSLNNIGSVYLLQGDYQNAVAYYNESLLIRSELNSPVEIPISLEVLASVIALQAVTAPLQEVQKAVRLMGAATAIRARVDCPIPLHNIKYYEEDIAALRNRLGPDTFECEWAFGGSLTLEQAVRYALNNQID